MQPEITREWIAEQLALCERAKIGAVEFIQAADAAARTGYPAVLRKLMEARDETPVFGDWLESIGGKSCRPGVVLFVRDGQLPLTFVAQDGGAWDVVLMGGGSAGWRLCQVTTRAAVLALLAAIGVGAKEKV